MEMSSLHCDEDAARLFLERKILMLWSLQCIDWMEDKGRDMFATCIGQLGIWVKDSKFCTNSFSSLGLRSNGGYDFLKYGSWLSTLERAHLRLFFCPKTDLAPAKRILGAKKISTSKKWYKPVKNLNLQSGCWLHCCFIGATSSSFQFRASSPNLNNQSKSIEKRNQPVKFNNQPNIAIKQTKYSNKHQIRERNWRKKSPTCNKVVSLSPLPGVLSFPGVHSHNGSASPLTSSRSSSPQIGSTSYDPMSSQILLYWSPVNSSI